MSTKTNATFEKIGSTLGVPPTSSTTEDSSVAEGILLNHLKGESNKGKEKEKEKEKESTSSSTDEGTSRRRAKSDDDSDEENRSSKRYQSGSRRTAQNLTKIWMDRKGAFKVEEGAKKIEPFLRELEPKQILIVFKLYKKCPLTRNEREDVVAKNVAAGIDAVTMSLGKSWSECTPKEKSIVLDYEKNARLVQYIGDRMESFTKNLSWDQIGMVYHDEIKALRMENLCLVPQVPDFFYSKAYFVSTKMSDAIEECECRLGFAALILGRVLGSPKVKEAVLLTSEVHQIVVNKMKKLPPMNYVTAKVTLKEAFESFAKSVQSELPLVDMMPFLECCFAIDIRMVVHSKEYKKNRSDPEFFRQYKPRIANYCGTMIAMGRLITEGARENSKFEALKGDEAHPFTASYYLGLRSVQKILRLLKAANYQGGSANPRENKESLESFITDDYKYVGSNKLSSYFFNAMDLSKSGKA
jgi:hypothetical protein